MRFRAFSALLLLLSACATTEPSPKDPVAPNPRIANLQRAASLPWADDGQCVVQEASTEWPVLVERCFHALDHEKIRFQDPTGRCAVASAGAAAIGVGVCILAAPEIIVGAVVIIGVVVVAAAIKEELDAYERRASRERARPESQTRPSNKQEPLAHRKPKPKGEPTPEESTEPFIPPIPTPEEREDWNERCRDHYARCKHSPEGERWGRKFSESQCQACWDLCRRTGQWPDEANDRPCPGG
jgi:hypothetical protein